MPGRGGKLARRNTVAPEPPLDVLDGVVKDALAKAAGHVAGDERAQDEAASRIQAAARGRKARREHGDAARVRASLQLSFQRQVEDAAAEESRHNAAAAIQARVRGANARARVAPLRAERVSEQEAAAERNAAAAYVQRHVRGHLVRADIRRRIQAHAMRVIALAARPMLRRARARLAQRERDQRLKTYAAEKIQAWARGTSARKAFARLYDSRAVCVCHTLPLHGAPLLTCEDCYETYHPRCLGYRDPGDDVPPPNPPEVPPLDEWDFDPDNPEGPARQQEHAALLAQHEAATAALEDFHARPPCPDRSLPWYCPACAAAHLPAHEVVFVAAPSGADANSRSVPDTAAVLSRPGGAAARASADGDAQQKRLVRPTSAVSHVSRVTYRPRQDVIAVANRNGGGALARPGGAGGPAPGLLRPSSAVRPISALSMVSLETSEAPLFAANPMEHAALGESISTKARERMVRTAAASASAAAAEDEASAAADALLRQYRHGFVAQSDPAMPRPGSAVPTGMLQRPATAAPTYPFAHDHAAPPPPRAAPDGVPTLDLSGVSLAGTSLAPPAAAPAKAGGAKKAGKKGALARRKSVSSASSDAPPKPKPKRRMSAMAKSRAAARALPPRPSTAPALRSGSERLAANPAWFLDATDVPASSLVPQFPASREELWRRGVVRGGGWRAAAEADVRVLNSSSNNDYRGEEMHHRPSAVAASLDSPRFRAIENALVEV